MAIVKFLVTVHTSGPEPTRQEIKEIVNRLDEGIQRQWDNVGITPDDYDGFAEMFSVSFQED